jgi:hypothetical protein
MFKKMGGNGSGHFVEPTGVSTHLKEDRFLEAGP